MQDRRRGGCFTNEAMGAANVLSLLCLKIDWRTYQVRRGRGRLEVRWAPGVDHLQNILTLSPRLSFAVSKFRVQAIAAIQTRNMLHVTLPYLSSSTVANQLARTPQPDLGNQVRQSAGASVGSTVSPPPGQPTNDVRSRPPSRAGQG